MKAWKLKIAAEYNQQLAQEGPVFNAKTKTLFFTSNRPNKGMTLNMSSFHSTTQAQEPQLTSD